jgi:site-specific recombinase XerD
MPVIQDLAALIAAGGPTLTPGKAKEEFGDALTPGLFLELRASGTTTWQLRLKNASGTNAYRRLGTLKDISLKQARALSKQIKAEHAVSVVAAGNAAHVVPKAEMTWSTYITEYFAPYCKAHIRSFKKYEQLERIYVAPRFGHLPLSKITRKEVQMLHVEMVEKMKLSPASADHMAKYMRRACSFATQSEYLAANPLKNFELFMVDNQVENYLSEEQLQRLLTVLRTDSNRNVCNILMLLLSTGARLNEILSATWKNVSIEGRALKVDAIRSKSKRSRSIPLNDSAMWVIEQLQSKGKSEYLFPSPVLVKRGKDLPYVNITRAWYRIQKLAGIKIRAHDLRHGFASMLVSGGRSLYEVQQILGHSDPKVTMRYAHLSSKTLQDAANAGSVIVPKVVSQEAKTPVTVRVAPVPEPVTAVSMIIPRVEPQEERPRVTVRVAPVPEPVTVVSMVVPRVEAKAA